MKTTKSVLFLLFLICMVFISSYAQETTIVNVDVSHFDKNQFHSALLNGIPFTLFLVYMIYGIFGIIGNMFSDVVRRVPESKCSPKKFSIGYWWSDNWRRVVTSLIFLPLLIIGCNDIFGWEITNFKAFCIGLGADHGAEIMKRKNFIIKGIQNFSNPDQV